MRRAVALGGLLQLYRSHCSIFHCLLRTERLAAQQNPKASGGRDGLPVPSPIEMPVGDVALDCLACICCCGYSRERFCLPRSSAAVSGPRSKEHAMLPSVGIEKQASQARLWEPESKTELPAPDRAQVNDRSFPLLTLCSQRFESPRLVC